MKKAQKIIIISSPSGCGKDTIVKELLQKYDILEKTISCTTRPKREGEKSGINYYFINEKKFKKNIAEKNFFEWQPVHTFYYGTLKKEIPRIIDRKKIPILIIEYYGAIKIKKIYPHAIMFFIMPNSMKNMVSRIKKRAAISDEEIKTRINSAKKELKLAKYYDHRIKNPEGYPEKAVKKISKILDRYLNDSAQCSILSPSAKSPKNQKNFHVA